MGKNSNGFLAKVFATILIVSTALSYYIVKYITGTAELPLKTILYLNAGGFALAGIALASLLLLIAVAIMLVRKNNEAPFTVILLLLDLMIILYYTHIIPLILLVCLLLALFFTVLVGRKRVIVYSGFSLIISSLVLLAGSLYLNSIGSSVQSTEIALSTEIKADDRVQSIVTASLRDKAFSFKVGEERVEFQDELNDENTRYFGQFHSTTCNESGSTSLKSTNRFDYRRVNDRYYTREAKGGNLWSHDGTGINQLYMDVEDLGILLRLGSKEGWALCSLLKDTLPAVSDLENTSSNVNSSHFFDLVVNENKVTTMYNRNLWLNLRDILGLRGLDLLTAYSKFKTPNVINLQYNAIRYDLDDSGVLKNIFIGQLRSKKFYAKSKIVLNQMEPGSIAKPNAVDNSPETMREILQIKNR